MIAPEYTPAELRAEIAQCDHDEDRAAFRQIALEHAKFCQQESQRFDEPQSSHFRKLAFEYAAIAGGAHG